jgi:hypothetical protein
VITFEGVGARVNKGRASASRQRSAATKRTADSGAQPAAADTSPASARGADDDDDDTTTEDEGPGRRGRTDDGTAFMPDPGGGPAVINDSLAENLAEEFLESATRGEPVVDDVLEEIVPEELGGPFVETTDGDEFASGTDGANPADAEREPFPRPVAGLVQQPPEDEEGDDDSL